MGRPRLQNARDRQFNVSLTASEFADLQRAARLAGVRPVDYGRAKLLSKPGRLTRTAFAVHQLDPLLLIQLSRLGNNINQIARRLNEFSLQAPEDLAPLLAELRGILRMVPEP
jgi:hypothetical protein